MLVYLCFWIFNWSGLLICKFNDHEHQSRVELQAKERAPLEELVQGCWLNQGKEHLSVMSSEEEEEPVATEAEIPRRESIGTVTKRVLEQIPVLEQMSTTNYAEVMDQFQEVFDKAADASQQHAQDYVEKAVAIEAALNALAEYNKKALEQLQNLIVEAIKEVDNPTVLPGKHKSTVFIG